MNDVSERVLPITTGDGHGFDLIARIPAHADRVLLWLPALGIAAKHYVPLADALAQRGIAVFLHEWRGHGSSSLRAGRACNWGYRELLDQDLQGSASAVRAALPDSTTRIIGGHSLGGQLACARLALDPDWGRTLWLVASGAPYWRAFPTPLRWMLPLVYRFVPWLADAAGRLPGRRIGFGGNEARGVMRDWAGTGLSGTYAVPSLDRDLEAALKDVDADVLAIVMQNDWLAPETSMRFLRSKMPHTRLHVTRLDNAALGTKADHFSWMAHPQAVAAALCAQTAAGVAAPSTQPASASGDPPP